MRNIVYLPELAINARNLGLEVNESAILAPAALRTTLESMGVRTPETLVSSLQSFPGAIAKCTGLDAQSSATAIAGAIDLLLPYLDSGFSQATRPARRGLGVLPPRARKAPG